MIHAFAVHVRLVGGLRDAGASGDRHEERYEDRKESVHGGRWGGGTTVVSRGVVRGVLIAARCVSTRGCREVLLIGVRSLSCGAEKGGGV